MSLSDLMTWDDIEKFMVDNPDTILSIYFLERATFLDDEPIILNGQRWGVNFKKLKQIPSDVFGLLKFALRKDDQDQKLPEGIGLDISGEAMNSLEPGIELDIIIAERVLGWYQDSDIGGPRAWWFKEGREGDREERALHLNYFSTDIKAAWDLAEKFRLCVVPMGSGWTATRLGQSLTDSEANKAPTAAHAICLAVLLYANQGKINV